MGSAVSNATDIIGEGLGQVRKGTTSTSADALTLGDRKAAAKLKRDPNFKLANDATVGMATVGPQSAITGMTALGLHDSLIMDPRRAELAMQNAADAAAAAVGDAPADPTAADLTGIQRQRSSRGRRGTILTGGQTLGGSSQGKTLLGL